MSAKNVIIYSDGTMQFSEPTGALRLLERSDGTRVLQQAWDIRFYREKKPTCDGIDIEWRDVPVEKE